MSVAPNPGVTVDQTDPGASVGRIEDERERLEKLANIGDSEAIIGSFIGTSDLSMRAVARELLALRGRVEALERNVADRLLRSPVPEPEPLSSYTDAELSNELLEREQRRYASKSEKP